MAEPSAPGFAQFEADLASASAALSAFAEGPAKRAADSVGLSFERAGQRIARALGSAASDGEVSFKRLAKVVLEELAKIALNQVLGGKAERAAPPSEKGGAFNALGAPLTSAAAGAVAVHFHLSGGDVGAVAKHQGQIAATIARAVAYGRRNL